ncbi:ribonuclease Z [Candidatus Woesearchaeota archaeon]|nr:ribonuclease Z [Candidatus Woesearchaeota archaeon]
MKITFLGTSAMVPTKERNHPGILINYDRENILLDCGENTQRQLKFINFSPSKITRLLISHWHGDHILGIPGLIQTLGANNYEKTLEIYGPKNSKIFIKKIMNSFLLKDKIKYKVHEVNGKFFENEDFYLEAAYLKHSAPCLSFSLIEKPKRRMNLKYLKKFNLTKHPLLGELQKGKDIVYNNKKIKAKDSTFLIKGKKITYLSDTILDNSCIKAAKDSDLLIAESTFANDLKEKAKKYQHLTAEQAALIAKKSKSKKLILTHFSQRYKNLDILEKEAKKIFKNTILAKDFMNIIL